MDEELGAKIKAMFVELHAHGYDGKHDKVLSINRSTWRALTPAAGRGRALGLPRNYAESKLGSQTFVLNGGRWFRVDRDFVGEVDSAVGELLGDCRLTVLCGGRQGVMQAVCEGVARVGGLSIGLLPDADASQANPFVSVPLATGIGEARTRSSQELRSA
jgi:hypothetical protein